jgi:SAM-dependent methyltransferase
VDRSFPDHFSGHARLYAEARPVYPPELFSWIAAQCPRRLLAWEAGCGSGQATAGLAAHFEQVIATDPSAAQIAAAPSIARVEYRVEAAEDPTLLPQSADLVLVAQAYHWLDHSRLHAVVRRILRDDGVIAVLAYGLLRIEPQIDRIIDRLYHDILADDWPEQRQHVDDGYRRLPFPYARLEPPACWIRHRWTLGQVLAYLATWSATQGYLQRRGEDPLQEVTADLERAWGTASSEREVLWPLTVLAGH